jgi:hypothetical protein
MHIAHTTLPLWVATRDWADNFGIDEVTTGVENKFKKNTNTKYLLELSLN